VHLSFISSTSQVEFASNLGDTPIPVDHPMRRLDPVLRAKRTPRTRHRNILPGTMVPLSRMSTTSGELAIGGLRPHGVEEPLAFMVFAGCEVGQETLVGNVHGCFGGFQQCPALVAG
jgi:hypothetical protein